MSQENFSGLLDKYVSGDLSADGKKQLREMMNDPANEATLEKFVHEIMISDDHSQVDAPLVKARIDAFLDAQITRQKAKIIFFKRVAVAASIAIIFTSAYLLLFNKKQAAIDQVVQHTGPDVAPPSANRATITLSGGQKIFLDRAGKGTLAEQGKVSIEKVNDGKIAYNGNGQPGTTSAKEIEYNTLFNPRGSKVIALTLSDGTQVWLNAESSLRYPVAFAGSERMVEITGEAYFEVVHDAKMPFKVRTKNGIVEDIGTHFNINAYGDEDAVRTTLLEGKLRIGNTILAPGEQGLVNSTNGHVQVSNNIDTAEVMAWKNGVFRFNDASIRTIMEQAARWYDVDIEYKTDNKLGFVATISRQVPISKLLKILELTDRVHFQIEGKKITVLP